MRSASLFVRRAHPMHAMLYCVGAGEDVVAQESTVNSPRKHGAMAHNGRSGVARTIELRGSWRSARRLRGRVCGPRVPCVPDASGYCAGTDQDQRRAIGGRHRPTIWPFWRCQKYALGSRCRTRSISSDRRARDLQLGGLEFDSLRGRSGGRFRPSVCSAPSVLSTHPPPSSGRNHISCD